MTNWSMHSYMIFLFFRGKWKKRIDHFNKVSILSQLDKKPHTGPKLNASSSYHCRPLYTWRWIFFRLTSPKNRSKAETQTILLLFLWSPSDLRRNSDHCAKCPSKYVFRSATSTLFHFRSSLHRVIVGHCENTQLFLIRLLFIPLTFQVQTNKDAVLYRREKSTPDK